MNKTAIEYLTHTYNPIAMRCAPVSEGCENCWHLTTCRRFAKNPNFTPEVRAAYAGGAPVLLADRLQVPLYRRKPAMIGVQFMGDLFHEDVPDEFIARVFMVMGMCPQHTFQVLTKRPKRMAAYLNATESRARLAGVIRGDDWPLANIWLGVTAENQATADERIPLLLQTPAAVRFVSLEPMLNAINIAPYLGQVHADGLGLPYKGDDPWYDGLDWVIVGAETGAGARPMHPAWPRQVRDGCVAAGVPFFFKGWGEWRPGRSDWNPGKPLQSARWIDNDGQATPWGYPQAKTPYYVKTSGELVPLGKSPPSSAVFMTHVGRKRAGRLLDGRKCEQCPETKKC